MGKRNRREKKFPKYKLGNRVKGVGEFSAYTKEHMEADTRLVVGLGIAARLLRSVEETHPSRAEPLPRETASFLIVHLKDKDRQEAVGLDIYSKPFCISSSSFATTRLVATRIQFLTEGESPMPEQIDDFSLETIRGIALARPLFIDPPLTGIR